MNIDYWDLTICLIDYLAQSVINIISWGRVVVIELRRGRHRGRNLGKIEFAAAYASEGPILSSHEWNDNINY